jgi:hypothetical protein
VSVPSQESEMSCICMKEVLSFTSVSTIFTSVSTIFTSVSTIFRLDFGTVLMVKYS